MVQLTPCYTLIPLKTAISCNAIIACLNFQLCAGGTYTDQSACPGDSGGGLQVQDNSGRWTLVGIVSNGPSVCGLQPVVFHKVENSIDWIVKTMQSRHSAP